MNLILFEEKELRDPLPMEDPRARHMLEILKVKEGDRIKGGVVNGSLIEITVQKLLQDRLEFSYEELPQKPSLCYPLTLLIGTPRPPTARRLLKDLTAIGVGDLIFTGTDLNEKSYLSSKLWKDKLYHHALIEGAQQGSTTQLPFIHRYYSLKKSLESLPVGSRGIFFHPQADLTGFKEYLVKNEPGPLVIALGPERGWSDREVEMLQQWGFQGLKLGERILRTETAATATATMVIQHYFI